MKDLFSDSLFGGRATGTPNNERMTNNERFY
jgi:hypothetical protein